MLPGQALTTSTPAKRPVNTGLSLLFRRGFLAKDLENYGEGINYRVLINRINRGSFSFALQILAALGVQQIEIKQPPPGISKIPTLNACC